MFLRNLPPSERSFATAVVVALAMALGLGLVSIFNRELRPVTPTQAPPARSRLMAVLEGVMAVNVTPAETERFKGWVASGATREGFAQVEPVVANNCASCHGQGEQFPRIASFDDLRPIALETAPAGIPGLFDARTMHLIGFSLIFLVGAGAYLRRTAWPRRRLLMGACVLAVVFDAAQWWLRQGRPEALWAAWTALALLTSTYLALAVVVLKELWMQPPRE